MKTADLRALVRAVLDLTGVGEFDTQTYAVPSSALARARLAAQVVARELEREAARMPALPPIPAPIEVCRRYDAVPGARMVWPWFELLPDGALESCGIAFRAKDSDGLMRQVVVTTDDREALLDDLRLCIELVDKYRESTNELLGLSAEDIARLIEVLNHAAI